MQLKLIRIFVVLSGVLLAVTATAKITSSFGSVAILELSAPILTFSFRHVFWIVGAVELAIALVCFCGKRLKLQVGLVAWLATSFLIYRLGLSWIGWHKPCSCLGNLTDALHIPPQTADTAMKIVLAYLLIGSYASLFWLWRQHRKAEGRMQKVKVLAGSSEVGVGN